MKTGTVSCNISTESLQENNGKGLLEKIKRVQDSNNMKKIPNPVTKPLVYTEKLAEEQYSCLHPKLTADTLYSLPLALSWDKLCLTFVLQ